MMQESNDCCVKRPVKLNVMIALSLYHMRLTLFSLYCIKHVHYNEVLSNKVKKLKLLLAVLIGLLIITEAPLLTL